MLGNYKLKIYIYLYAKITLGLPWWLSGKEHTCQCRRFRFDPWVKKIPWRRAWQPTSVAMDNPGECLENPIDKGARQTTVHAVTRVRYDLATNNNKDFV